MTGTIDLHDEVMEQNTGWISPDRPDGIVKAHDCHGCGEFRPDVDLWATNSETGEELWLCEDCADS